MKLPQYIIDGLAKFAADLQNYVNSLSKQPPTPIPPIPEPKPIPPSIPLTIEQIKAAHPSGWAKGTLEERRAMMMLCRRVQKEEGMSISLAADMWGTIWGESGWNQYCIALPNKNGTVDYGIAQFNSNTYLKEYKMSPVEVLTNPERCLRIMARNFKAGRQRNWFGYKPGDANFQTNRLRGL